MTVPPSSPIPMLFGPNELTLDMLGYYQQAADLIKPLGRVPQPLVRLIGSSTTSGQTHQSPAER